MIRFHKLTYTNFLSSGSTPIEITLDQDNSTIVTGENGAGKTTFIDALSYVLFNKPLRDVKLGQLVNTINKKKMLVEVEFSTNGKNYKIRRGQKPTIFEIWENNEQIEVQASARDMQNIIEEQIIRTNYKTFTQVVVLASMKFQNFMDLSPGDRRVVVEQMLDIEVIGKMSDLLKQRLKSATKSLSNVEFDSNDISNKIEAVNRLIEANTLNKDRALDIVDGQIDEIKSKLFEVEEAQQELINKNNEHLKPKPDVDVEASRQSFIDLRDKRVQLLNDAGDLTTKAKMELGEKHRLVKEVEFFNSHDTCNVCNQDISAEFKTKRIIKLNGAIAKFNHNIDIWTKQSRKLTEQAEQLSEKMQELQNLADEINLWSQTQAQLNAQMHFENSRHKREHDALISKMQERSEVMSASQGDVQELYDKLNDYQNKMNEIATRRSELNEEIELCKLGTQMLKDNGLKAKIIKQYLPIINDSINFYLDKMGAHYSFTLNEEFDETIKSRFRDTFSYSSFSNGESMRINIAIMLMWRKLAESKNTVHTNLLILDEVLDGSLDKSGISDVLNLFESMNGNIFCISHRHEIIDNFDRHVNVSKIGNFSHYEGLYDEQ